MKKIFVLQLKKEIWTTDRQQENFCMLFLHSIILFL